MDCCIEQDHLLPYMADERHAPDTLFLVAEEDFRLFSRHSALQPAVLQGVAEAAYAASSTAFVARPAFAEVLNEEAAAPPELTLDELYYWRYQAAPHLIKDDVFGPPAAGTNNWKALVGGLYAPTAKPTAAEIEQAGGVSEYLIDLVKMVTAAHRQGLGDLVWLSYDAFKTKGFRSRVCHAATLIAVSAAGAKKLVDIVADPGVFGANQHFDVLLLKYLEKHGNTFGASYVYPCVGHYQAHLSQSSDHEGWRDSAWEQNWVQEGTKASHAYGGRTRWLMGWTKRGDGLDWKVELFLPERGDVDLRWFTRTSAPQGWIEAEEERLHEQAEWAKGKGKTPRTPNVIQPFFREGPTDLPDNPPANTQRRKRQRRANLVGYAHRLFASPGQQVVFGKKNL